MPGPQAPPSLVPAVPSVPVPSQGKPKESYENHMRNGNNLILVKAYPAAAAHFQLALVELPGDPVARKKQSYANHMHQGTIWMTAKSYQSAATQFRLALIDQPGDLEAMNLLRKTGR